MKRLLDILIGSLVLLVLAPVLLVVAGVVRARLGSPVLFRQQRPGLGGRPFTLIKFRTMSDAHDAQGNRLTDAERLTALGRFLRRSSLDELPELFNVLRGEMSLVGPRPLLMEYLPLYNARQRRRHEVRPGMTGWAQVNGRNAELWDVRLEQDVWYVENRTFWLDAKIIWKTLRVVLGGQGVQHDGHATMPAFKGDSLPASSGRDLSEKDTV